MKIRVNNVTVENKGKWKKAVVDFVNLDTNNNGSATVVSFGDTQKAFLTLTQASNGDSYDVKVVKNGEYFNWVEAVKLGDVALQSAQNLKSANGTTSPRTTFETPEERAQRQIYIVRQSSLERSLEYLSLTGDKKATVADVVNLAQQFADFVFNGVPEPEVDVQTIMKDVPY